MLIHREAAQVLNLLNNFIQFLARDIIRNKFEKNMNNLPISKGTLAHILFLISGH